MVSNVTGTVLWILLIVALMGLVAMVGAWIHLMNLRPCPHCQKLMSKKTTACPYCGKEAVAIV